MTSSRSLHISGCVGTTLCVFMPALTRFPGIEKLLLSQYSIVMAGATYQASVCCITTQNVQLKIPAVLTFLKLCPIPSCEKCIK